MSGCVVRMYYRWVCVVVVGVRIKARVKVSDIG